MLANGNLFDMHQFLGAKCPVLDIVDIGAMDTGEGTNYSNLLEPGKFRLVGFEPVQAECDKLNARAGPGRKFLPYFVGDGSERNFHHNSFTMTSSLYETNHRLVDRFQSLGELMQTQRIERVKTRRLDDIPELTRADFLSIDVQGAELDSFRNGRRLLRNTLVIETEVSFVHMYKDQPLFGEVDAELRGQGFFFHMFNGIAGRPFKPLQSGKQDGSLRQMLWSNAVYVRDPLGFSQLAADDLLRIALIMHQQYASCDLAAQALQQYKAKTGDDLWTSYLTTLLGTPPPDEPQFS